MTERSPDADEGRGGADASDAPRQTEAAATRDPISESYRSIIDVINRTSNGFKEGKKWKCSSGGSGGGGVYGSATHVNHQQQWRQLMVASQCRSGSSETAAIAGRGLNRAKGRKLVRQKATNMDDVDFETELHEPLVRDRSTERAKSASLRKATPHKLATTRGLPSRQWTVDACTGLRQEGTVSASTTAYLLRPVSKGSISSTSGHNEPSPSSSTCYVRRTSPFSDRSRSPAVADRSRMLESCRSGPASANHSFDATGSVSPSCSRTAAAASARVYERMPPAAAHHGSAGSHGHLRQLRKQKTSESAPSRHLPRQFSNASAYSAYCGMPSSYSHQGITLVRGASCSLVDIPTYLGPSLTGVEVAQICDVSFRTAAAVPALSSTSAVAGVLPAAAGADALRKPLRPRLQLDLTRKTNSTAKTTSARKTQWTVLCVSLTLLTLAVTLVGTMLSVGSKYQDKHAPRHNDSMLKNQSRSSVTTSSPSETSLVQEEVPFVIVPDARHVAGPDKSSASPSGLPSSTSEGTLVRDGLPVLYSDPELTEQVSP
jgi:hypothetical protein